MTHAHGTTERTRIQEALAYISQRIPIFPLAPDTKQPIERAGHENIDGIVIPEGQGGFHQATIDEAKVRRWWAAYPDANIGCPTGHYIDAITGEPNAYPFDVLDVDVRHGGLESVRALMLANEPLPATACQITGTNGFHYCFEASADLRNSAGGIAAGLDVRAKGGYIVLSPSVHPDTGQRYEWQIPPLSPEGVSQLKPWPEWLTTLIKAASRRRQHSEPGARIPLGQQEAYCMRVAGAIRRQGGTEQEILAALTVISQERCDPPIAPENLARMATSASNYDPAHPLLELPLSDSGNAERNVIANEGEIHYNAVTNEWLVWNGRVHERDTTLAIDKRTLNAVRATGRLAMEMPPGDRGSDAERAKKAMVSWALRSESHQSIQSMIARTRPLVSVTPDQLDRDPWLFACANGVIDLQTGTLRASRRDDLITKSSPVVYDPDARLELWERYLRTFTGGEKSIHDLLQLLAGASLSGISTDQLIAMLIGEGGSGKTTFLEALLATWGDYGHAANFSTFIAKHHVSNGPSPENVSMATARLVTAVEVGKGQRFASELLKQLTGGDHVSARGMYAKTETTFTPGLTPWLAANTAPEIDKDDTGLWRRVALIPVVHVIPEDERDPQVKLTLRNPDIAGPAILAWAVEGCLKWQAAKLRIEKPKIIKDATEQYQASMDPLNQFIDEYCELGPQFKETPSNMSFAYASFCQFYRIKPMGKQAFKENLRQRKITQQSSGDRLYQGIRAKALDSTD